MAFKMRKFSGFKAMQSDNMSVEDIINEVEKSRIRNMENVLENPENYSRKRVNRNIQRFRKFKSKGKL